MSRRASDLHPVRLVPHPSPVHRLWAGTKLLALVAISVTLSITPTWPAVLLIGTLVGVGVVIARIPAGAAPRLPRWFIAVLALGGGLALLAGGDPMVQIGGVSLGFDGLNQWARAVAIGTTIITAAMLLSWTTPLGDIGPALSRLGAPLRRLRLPVDEWAVSTALALRCLPLLLEEIRTILAVRRLRADPARGPGRRHHTVASLLGLLATVVIVSMRRAREIGDAIEARGGWGGAIGDRARFTGRDAVTLVVVFAVTAIPLTLFR
jgi:energy-coupling factor transporter transmembrane protein EcfT